MSDDESENVQQFGDEQNVYDRVTQGNMVLNSMRNMKFKDMNSTEQFYKVVNATFMELLNMNTGFIHIDDLSDILENIYTLDRPGYKNAPSYILGYYASKGGTEITKKSVDLIFKNLNQVTMISTSYPNFSIKKQDVIRYARLWLSINKDKT